MKTKELQIDDWVKIDYNSQKVKVTAVYNNWIDTSSISPLMSKVSPIPLTLEILEKNGFELRDGFLYHRIDDKPHHYDFKLKNGGVFTSEGYTLECGIYHLTIRYVHELQHALRLCGLNDLADNLKLEE